METIAKVVFNGKFLTQKITGVQRYAFEIIFELDRISRPHEFIVLVPNVNIHFPTYKNIKIVKYGFGKGILWEQFSFPLYLLMHDAVGVNLCNVAPFIRPDIVCVHDMNIHRNSQFYSMKFVLWYRFLFRSIFRKAREIITVSQFSLNEIRNFYPRRKNSICVVSEGWQHFNRIAGNEMVMDRHGLVKNQYFFSMSSLAPNKNLNWIINVAYRNPKEIFIVAGLENSKVFGLKNQISKIKNVLFIGYVSDDESRTLMHNCKAFIFPTFYEGFGLPPLEALSTGAKVIVSDIPCLKEILGDAVYYIDPYDYNVDLGALLQKEIVSPNKTLNQYDWKKSANILLQILKKYTE